MQAQAVRERRNKYRTATHPSPAVGIVSGFASNFTVSWWLGPVNRAMFVLGGASLRGFPVVCRDSETPSTERLWLDIVPQEINERPCKQSISSLHCGSLVGSFFQGAERGLI